MLMEYFFRHLAGKRLLFLANTFVKKQSPPKKLFSPLETKRRVKKESVGFGEQPAALMLLLVFIFLLSEGDNASIVAVAEGREVIQVAVRVVISSASSDPG